MTGTEWTMLWNEGWKAPQIRRLDFFRWCVRSGRVSEGNPTAPLNLPPYMTDAEEQALIQAWAEARRWLR